jgi:cell division protein FtsI/penicillin-binding protein 2
VRRVVVGGAALVALLAAGVGAWVVLRSTAGPLPTTEARAWLAAWQRNEGDTMARAAIGDTSGLPAAVTSMRDGLRVTDATYRLGRLVRRGDRATASFSARLELSGLGEWGYDGTFRLVQRAGAWKVDWSPVDLHPDLAAGLHWARTRSWPTRAPILGGDGAPLVADTDAVTVGVQPGRVRDRAALTSALQKALGVSPSTVIAAISAPGVRPDFFVAVKALRPPDFDRVRPQLEPVPGVVFQRTHARLPPTDTFGVHVLGRVGPATAERLAQLGPPYLAGDSVGMSGLEAAFEGRLAGRPSGEVRLVDATGKVAKVVGRIAGAAPQQVATTLDARVQQAAETALAGVTQPAALVAIDAPTGQIRAVVSMPLDSAFDRALVGRYPPGSTFKVVTAAALLENGSTPESPTTCPARAVVGGKPFTNFEDETVGSLTLRTAFAVSCNTAFVSMADHLPEDAVGRAAGQFGFDDGYTLPLPAAGGRFPEPRDAAERAAAAIGQARVEASPLHMATVAAAADAGAWRAPRLLSTDPEPPAKPLDPAVDGALRQLMDGVVRSGTGTAAAVPGVPVSGKTGTAEFGPGNPPSTHAWFIGFRGDLAFSVLVEGGGVGGRVAAPLAAGFLNALRP